MPGPISSEQTGVARAMALAESLAGTLRTAEALLRAERRLDLSGLERQADTLCHCLLALPADLAQPFAMPLRALVARVDAVVAALQSGAG